MRLPLIALCVLLLGLFSGQARAADTVIVADRAAAYAQCEANRAATQASGGTAQYKCDYVAAAKMYRCIRAEAGVNGICTKGVGGAYIYAWVGTECTAGGKWNEYTKQCQADCATKAPTTGGFTPPNGSLRCDSGCSVVYLSNGDGTSTAAPTGGMCDTTNFKNDCGSVSGYYWHPTLNVCAPVEEQDCKPGQAGEEGICKKPEQCPQGMKTDENGLCKPADPQCPAGATKGPDGSCVDDKNTCKAGEAKKKDGTCGKDENNDGTPDDEDNDPSNDTEENEFSGGDDCKTPPSCSGDAILCGQARIQWRIDCNTRRNVNLSGGGCNNPPQCQGEKCTGFEMAQLVQQWRTACAVESLKTIGGDGNGQQPEWTKPTGMSQDPGQGVQPGDTPTVKKVSTSLSDLDQSGFGGGTCAPIMAGGGGQLSSAFAQSLASPPPMFCDFISLIKGIVILSAAAYCAYILAKG